MPPARIISRVRQRLRLPTGLRGAACGAAVQSEDAGSPVQIRTLIAALAVMGWFGACGCSSVVAVDAASLRLYEVTTETGMPHLEENLRYASVTQTRCLNTDDLSRAFWMLDDVSLQDCTLVKTAESVDAAAYLLRCSGGHGTTGNANWQLGPGTITGTLHVRLGGKNMTLYQRIKARPIGTCG